MEEHMANAQDYIVVKNGKQLAIGDTVKDYCGNDVILSGFQPPRHEGSTGRVDLRASINVYLGSFYPSVVGAAIISKKEWADRRPQDDQQVKSYRDLNKYLQSFTSWSVQRDPSGYYYFTHAIYAPSTGVYVYTWRGSTYGFWRRELNAYIAQHEEVTRD
jgi:hypothetical protein